MRFAFNSLIRALSVPLLAAAFALGASRVRVEQVMAHRLSLPRRPGARPNMLFGMLISPVLTDLFALGVAWRTAWVLVGMPTTPR